MRVEGEEQLRSWLTAELASVNADDPDELSNYVLALLRKDESVDKLRAHCLDQLGMLMTQGTEKFVERLFATLRTRDYLKRGASKASDRPSSAQRGSSSRDQQGSPAFSTGMDFHRRDDESEGSSSRRDSFRGSDRFERQASSDWDRDHRRRRDRDDVDDDDRDYRRRRNSSPGSSPEPDRRRGDDRKRQRIPSADGSDRARQRSRYDHPLPTHPPQQPPFFGARPGHGPPGRYEPRPPHGFMPPGMPRPPGMMPGPRPGPGPGAIATPFDNSMPRPPMQPRFGAPRPAFGVAPADMYNSYPPDIGAPPRPVGQQPQQPQQPPPMAARPPGAPQWRPPAPQQQDAGAFPPREKPRMDGQAYAESLGLKLGQCFKFARGLCTRGDSCRYSHDLSTDPRAGQGGPGRSSGQDDAAGGGSGRNGSRRRDDAAPGRGDLGWGREDPGPSGRKGGKRSLTKLELVNVPPQLNTIAQLNEHFSKFGTIISLQVGENALGQKDAKRSVVEYRSSHEARQAYSNPEAVFGNRFIKMFFAVEGSAAPAGRAGKQAPEPIVELKPTQKVISSSSTSNPARGRAPRGSKPATPAKKTLQQKTADLVMSLSQQQKKLIEKLETSKDMSQKDRKSIMGTINSLSQLIENATKTALQKAKDDKAKVEAAAAAKKKKRAEEEQAKASKGPTALSTESLQLLADRLEKRALSMGLDVNQGVFVVSGLPSPFSAEQLKSAVEGFGLVEDVQYNEETATAIVKAPQETVDAVIEGLKEVDGVAVSVSRGTKPDPAPAAEAADAMAVDGDAAQDAGAVPDLPLEDEAAGADGGPQRDSSKRKRLEYPAGLAFEDADVFPRTFSTGQVVDGTHYYVPVEDLAGPKLLASVEAVGSRTVLCGRAGAGKTHHIQWLIAQLAERGLKPVCCSMAAGASVHDAAAFWGRIGAQFGLEGGVDSIIAFVRAMSGPKADPTAPSLVWVIEDLDVLMALPETNSVRKEVLIAIKTLCETAARKAAGGEATPLHAVVATHCSPLGALQSRQAFAASHILELPAASAQQVARLVLDFCSDRRDCLSPPACEALVAEFWGRSAGHLGTVGALGEQLQAHLVEHRAGGADPRLGQFRVEELRRRLLASEGLNAAAERQAVAYLGSSFIVTSQVLTACTAESGAILPGDVRTRLNELGVCGSDGRLAPPACLLAHRFFSTALPDLARRRLDAVPLKPGDGSLDPAALLRLCVGRVAQSIVKPRTARAFATDVYLTLSQCDTLVAVPHAFDAGPEVEVGGVALGLAARSFLSVLHGEGRRTMLHVEFAAGLGAAQHAALAHRVAASPLLAGAPAATTRYCLNFVAEGEADGEGEGEGGGGVVFSDEAACRAVTVRYDAKLACSWPGAV